MITAPDLPSGESAILRNAVRDSNAAAGSRMERRISPGRKTLVQFPVTNSVTGS